MNILIIGSEGRMGQFHAKHAAKYGTVLHLDTVLNQSSEEQRDLMDRTSAAIIATPTNTHREWAFEMIERGIPTLIEKPVASNLFDATAIRAAADFAKVPVHVGYLNRFNPAWHEFAAAIDGPGRFWFNRSGRLVGREYGGAGLDLATHDIDLVYQRWPNAQVKATIRAQTVHQLEVYVPDEGVSGRITARYAATTKAPNIRELTWAGNDGFMQYADLTQQFTLQRQHDKNWWEGDQVDLQMQAWLLGGKGVATIEDGIKAMEALG